MNNNMAQGQQKVENPKGNVMTGTKKNNTELGRNCKPVIFYLKQFKET
jgi:hypothetical protein